MSFWTSTELSAMDVVSFETTDAKGAKITFSTPPGVKLTCKGRPWVWQVAQGLGQSGAVARFVGIGLATGTLVLTMLTAEHRVIFDTGCGKHLVSPPQGQPAKIFTAYHPRLARLKISQIRLEGEPGGDWDEKTQVETVTYEWAEHRKPLPTLSAATTAGTTPAGSTAKSKASEALDARKAQIKTNMDVIGKGLAKS